MMNVEGEILVLKERITQLQKDKEDGKEEVKELKVIIYDTRKELQAAKDNFMLQKAAYDKLIAKGAGIALALTTLGTLVGWLWSNFVPKGH
jgi:phage shock protein A